jgi:hypothetical protein
MKTTWKSLALVCITAIACMMLGSSPARAQTFSFGYSGPGVSVGVNTGSYGYFGGPGYYTGGYPILAPNAFVAGPVAPIYVRPPVVLGGPIIAPRPYVVARPYARYRPYPGYYYGRGRW